MLDRPLRATLALPLGGGRREAGQPARLTFCRPCSRNPCPPRYTPSASLCTPSPSHNPEPPPPLPRNVLPRQVPAGAGCRGLGRAGAGGAAVPQHWRRAGLLLPVVLQCKLRQPRDQRLPGGDAGWPVQPRALQLCGRALLVLLLHLRRVWQRWRGVLLRQRHLRLCHLHLLPLYLWLLPGQVRRARRARRAPPPPPPPAPAPAPAPSRAPFPRPRPRPRL